MGTCFVESTQYREETNCIGGRGCSQAFAYEPWGVHLLAILDRVDWRRKGLQTFMQPATSEHGGVPPVTLPLPVTPHRAVTPL